MILQVSYASGIELGVADDHTIAAYQGDTVAEGTSGSMGDVHRQFCTRPLYCNQPGFTCKLTDSLSGNTPMQLMIEDSSYGSGERRYDSQRR